MCAAVVSMQRDRSSRERVDRALNSRDNYFPGELRPVCGSPASQLSERSFLHAAGERISRATADHGVPRDGSRSPAALGVASRWSRDGNARGAPAFGRRGATHPSSPKPPGPRAVAHGTLRELPNHAKGRGRAAHSIALRPKLQLSDQIAASSTTRLYFAPVLRSRPTLVRPVLHNQ